MKTPQHHVNVDGYFIEDLGLGMEAVFAKTITEADIVLFSGVTGDMNPVHVNEEFAKETMFKGRIAHGMLTGSLISTVLGMKMPGPGCIYISQTLNFKAPVRPGDTAVAHAEIINIDMARKRITMATKVSVADKVVLDGEAKMLVRSRT